MVNWDEAWKTLTETDAEVPIDSDVSNDVYDTGYGTLFFAVKNPMWMTDERPLEDLAYIDGLRANGIPDDRRAQRAVFQRELARQYDLSEEELFAASNLLVAAYSDPTLKIAPKDAQIVILPEYDAGLGMRAAIYNDGRFTHLPRPREMWWQGELPGQPLKLDDVVLAPDFLYISGGGSWPFEQSGFKVPRDPSCLLSGGDFYSEEHLRNNVPGPLAEVVTGAARKYDNPIRDVAVVLKVPHAKEWDDLNTHHHVFVAGKYDGSLRT